MISDALILMAGTGSRLRHASAEVPKPLVQVAGRPLISYAFEAFAEAGVETVHAVVGANAASLLPALQACLPSALTLQAIHNPDWRKQNGISVLRAAGQVRAPFFLAMGDHLFEPAILDRLLAQTDPARLNLAIDRKIDAIFDLDDAMKVLTQAGRVTAIAKDLADYDAIDTGLFVCPATLFDYLERAQVMGDCSLADGVRLMAAEDKVQAIDIGDAWWQDVDTEAMWAAAEERMRDPQRNAVRLRAIG